MPFCIESVAYRDFRNMAEFELEPSERLTILVGCNAVGKTNCVEGIQLLTAGTTFRHVPAGDLIRQGCERAGVSMHVTGEKRRLDVAYDIFPTKKLLSVNGKRRPNREGRGILPSILFYPDELLVVKGGAAGRRELFDDFGEQLNAGYAKIASDYRRTLMQRNSLLKDFQAPGGASRAGEGMLEAWTESLVVSGAMLYIYRTSMIARLAPHIARVYGELAGGEELDVAYECAYLPQGLAELQGAPAGARGECSIPGACIPADSHAARTAVQDALRRKLDELRDDELRRGQTLAGPHLDDVAFAIEGRSARAFGSQGQQRTLVLAIKLAQVQLVYEMKGTYPVFLLDDVMSELDDRRRSRLFDVVQSGMQTIVTTTNLAYFRPEELELAKVVRLGDDG